MRFAWLCGCVMGVAPMASADPLTFAEALGRASAEAPSVLARRADTEAARLLIKPAGELPDPQLALGVQNLPVSGPDRLELNRDFMTMQSVGVMQEVPNGEKREARVLKATADAGTARAALDVARLEARLEAARLWIEAYYGVEELRVLETVLRELDGLVDATTAGLSAGSGSADAALAARLEASRIADRMTDTRLRIAAARAELERWVGPLGTDDIGPAPPSFDIQPDRLRLHLEHHVAVALALAEIAQARAGVDLARADRTSDWSWEVMYQKREPAFSDMVSFGVRFSLPLFQSSRQSPTIDARQAELRRAQADRDGVLRQYRAHLETLLADYAATRERLNRLSVVQLPLARQRQAVAEAGQAAGTASLADAINARTAVLEMDLQRLALERQLTQLGATLTIEHGETTS